MAIDGPGPGLVQVVRHVADGAAPLRGIHRRKGRGEAAPRSGGGGQQEPRSSLSFFFEKERLRLREDYIFLYTRGVLGLLQALQAVTEIVTG